MDDLRINDDKNIYDVALELYGDISYTFKLIQDNESVTSIDDALTGLNLTYDPQIKIDNQKNSIPANKIIKEEKTEDTFTAFEGQSLFDMALQLHGTLESIYTLIQDNNIDSINVNVLSQKDFDFTIQKKSMLDYFTLNNVIVNTSTPKIQSGRAFSSGFKKVSFT